MKRWGFGRRRGSAEHAPRERERWGRERREEREREEKGERRSSALVEALGD